MTSNCEVFCFNIVLSKMQVMSSPVSIRLDTQIRRRVGQIAKRKHVSASEVIREAIEAWVEGQENLSPFDAMKDLIGSVRGGNPKRSVGGAREISKLLNDRRRHS